MCAKAYDLRTIQLLHEIAMIDGPVLHYYIRRRVSASGARKVSEKKEVLTIERVFAYIAVSQI